MNRKLCLSLATVALLGGAAWGQGQRVIVTFKGKADPAAVRRAGGQVGRTYRIVPACAATLPAAALAALQRHPQVLRVEADRQVYAVGPGASKKPEKPGGGGGKPPKDPPQPDQVLPWGVDRIDAEAARPAAGAGVKVAVLDTGIDKDHPDLAVAGGVRLIRGKPSKWDDDEGHGTHVAGTIAALDNNIGVVGVAPSVELYAVKALDSTGSGWVSDIIAGIEWSVVNEMDVVSMSLGLASDVQAFGDACDAASDAGIVLVAAAGNEGAPVLFPAAYGSVIAVVATAADDVRPWWSNYGPEVELAAPGVDIYSTTRGGGYGYSSGTSMACPHVTGVVALILGEAPGAPPLAVRVLLQDTADDLGPAGDDPEYGGGLVDAEEAVAGTQSGDN